MSQLPQNKRHHYKKSCKVSCVGCPPGMVVEGGPTSENSAFYPRCVVRNNLKNLRKDSKKLPLRCNW